jgi:hypothetical protein
MVQIINEQREPSFSEKFGRALNFASRESVNQIPQLLMNLQQQRQQQEAFKNLGMPEGFSFLPEEMQKILLTQSSKTKIDDNQKNAKAGLNALQRMKDLLSTKNLGVLSKTFGLFSPEVRRNRAEFEQLGKSLIPLASNIPIRNQAEFEVLSKKLYDPNQTDASIQGTLDAMERILKNSLEQQESDFSTDLQNKYLQTGKDKKRPELSSFYR